jgi:hypothetical protein
MVGEHCNVLHNSQLHLQHESMHGSILVEGECSSIMEDTPTSTKHGRRRHVMGTV